MTPPRFEELRDDLLRLREENRGRATPEVAWLDAGGIGGPEERLRWLLLRCALDQGIGVRVLDRLCSRLLARFGGALWELPAPRQSALEAVLREDPALKGWLLERPFCGIVWSASRFARERAPLVSYMRKDPDAVLGDAARSIFWFGKSSDERRKARRFVALAAAPAPWGLGLRRAPAEWDGWTFPLWRGSLEFWSRRRAFWPFGGRLRRADVARLLSDLARRADPAAPDEIACAMRWCSLREELGC